MKAHPIRWAIATALASMVGAYALIALLVPGVRSPLIVARLQSVPVALILHLIGGSLAIVLGAFQLNSKIRARHLALHRWMGRCYVVAVLMGGCAALYLAPMADGGLPTALGFGLLGVLWIGSTLTAYFSIRRRRIEAHRIWMLRSYALTFAAVTLRIYLPLSIMAGLPFPQSYVAIAWLCWVPNLIFIEWFVLTRPAPKPSLAGPTLTSKGSYEQA